MGDNFLVRSESIPRPRLSSGKMGVVTVLFNSSAVLPGFFGSLASQQFKNFHVWAVDNASTDDSVSQCRTQEAGFSIIENHINLGVAAGNNQGIRAALAAGCEYVLLLNNDVEFGPKLFSQLLEGLSINSCQMTAPIMYYFDRPDIVWAAGGKFQPIYGYRCYHLAEGIKDIGQFRNAHRIQHAPTCCILFRRSVFDLVGFMDERYFVYHDDTDFMLRCLKAGQRLFLLPHAKLLHKVSSLTGGAESDFSIRMATRNRIYMLCKFLGRVMGTPFVVGLSFLYVMRKLTRRDSRERHKLKQRSLREGFSMAHNWLPFNL